MAWKVSAIILSLRVFFREALRVFYKLQRKQDEAKRRDTYNDDVDRLFRSKAAERSSDGVDPNSDGLSDGPPSGGA